MRTLYADTSHQIDVFKDHATQLEQTEGDANEAAQLMKEFNEEMEGDFAMMKRKDDWNKQIDHFTEACLGKKKEVPATTLDLSKYLTDIISAAEPSIQPNATTIVGWHPLDNEMIKVFYATENAEMKMGKTMKDIRDAGHNVDITPTVWRVMRGGDAEMQNAHGLDKASKVGRSVCPLKTTYGNTFGCVVSGPPCIPDPLLEQLCRQAGPLLEHVWKTEQAMVAVNNVMEFLKKATSFNKQLVYVTFKQFEAGDFKRPGANGDVWGWQPLMGLSSDKEFILPLRWKFGDPVGVLRMTCGTFTKIDEQLIVLFMVMSEVIKEAVTEIEGLTPGDAPPLNKMDKVLGAYEAMRMRSPQLMQDEINDQLRIFDASKVFSEIKFLKEEVIDGESQRMVQAILIMCGHKRKDLLKWAQVQTILKNPGMLHEKMLELNITDGTDQGPGGERWAEAQACLKNLDIDAIEENCVQSLGLLIRWYKSVNSGHSIATAIEQEAKPPPPDPVADAVFDQIDTDKSGFIDAKELVVYMLKEYTSKVAHTLLRVLDADADKKITRDEWRRGWADGLLDQVLLKEHERVKETAQEGARLARRRGSSVMAMSAAAAARSIDPERLKELMGECDGAPKKDEGKKKKAAGAEGSSKNLTGAKKGAKKK